MNKHLTKSIGLFRLLGFCIAAHTALGAIAPTTLTQPQGSIFVIGATSGTSSIQIFMNNQLTLETISFNITPATAHVASTWGINGESTVTQDNNGRVTVAFKNDWQGKPIIGNTFTISFGLPVGTLQSISNVAINGIALTTRQADALLPVPSSSSSETPAQTPGVTPITFSYVTPVDPSPGYIYADSYPTHIFEPYTDITLPSIIPWSMSPANFATTYNIITTDMVPVGALDMVKKANLKGIRFAFITDNGGSIGWGPTLALNFAAPVVQQLQSKGIPVIISMGGSAGTFPGTNDGTYAVFYKYLEQIITIYPGVGLCFDIEGSDPLGLPGNETLQKTFAQAAVAIQKKYNTPMILTIPILPSGLNAGTKALITAAQQVGLNFYINIMAMDYGANADGKDETGKVLPMSQLAIQAAKNTANFLQTLYPNESAEWCLQHVQVTPMIGYNDQTQEIFTLNDAQILTKWARENDVQLCMWSLTRDFPGGTTTNLVDATFSGPNIQTAPYEFSKIFEAIDQ